MDASFVLQPPSGGFAILVLAMPPDLPPASRDRRRDFRMTIVLPVRIQVEADAKEGVLRDMPVNLSAGGIGFLSDTECPPGEILAITLRLQEDVLFTARAEVLRQEPLPSRPHIRRIHARFIKMSEHDRELLIGHIMRLQRAHLHTHYSA
jgi:c-di-GMP-binding flagellar brake protein YcgR